MNTHGSIRDGYPFGQPAGHHQQELIDMADWHSEQRARDERLSAGSKFAAGRMVAPNDTTALLEAVIRPKDRICLEGDNQKRADFLAGCLAKADPKVLHDLHVVQSGIVLPEHIDLFEKGIAKNRSSSGRANTSSSISICPSSAICAANT
jgi:malonate decarboxylase alpha subunit